MILSFVIVSLKNIDPATTPNKSSILRKADTTEAIAIDAAVAIEVAARVLKKPTPAKGTIFVLITPINSDVLPENKINKNKRIEEIKADRYT